MPSKLDLDIQPDQQVWVCWAGTWVQAVITNVEVTGDTWRWKLRVCGASLPIPDLFTRDQIRSESQMVNHSLT